MTAEMESVAPAPLESHGRRLAEVVATALFLLLAAGEGLHCYRSAHTSTDTMDYVMIAESDHANLMLKAEQECVEQLPSSTSGCSDMAAHSSYNREIAQYSEPQLQEYLRLYRVKPLFCATLRLLVQHAGMDGLRALRTVCAVSFVLVGLLLWLWLRVYLTALAASVAGALILTFPVVVRMGQSLTPDTMACVFFLLALYFILYKKWIVAGVAAFVLLILTRPENVLLAVFFGLAWIAWSAMEARRKLAWGVALVAGAVALRLGVGHFTHPVPWGAFFYTSFVRILKPDELATMHVTVKEYVRAMLTIGANSVAQYLPLPVLLGLMAGLSSLCPLVLRRLLLVCAVVTVARFALYPTMDERFYTPFLIVTMVSAVVSAARGMTKQSFEGLGRSGCAELASDH